MSVGDPRCLVLQVSPPHVMVAAHKYHWLRMGDGIGVVDRVGFPIVHVNRTDVNAHTRAFAAPEFSTAVDVLTNMCDVFSAWRALYVLLEAYGPAICTLPRSQSRARLTCVADDTLTEKKLRSGEGITQVLNPAMSSSDPLQRKTAAELYFALSEMGKGDHQKASDRLEYLVRKLGSLIPAGAAWSRLTQIDPMANPLATRSQPERLRRQTFANVHDHD